MTMINHGESSPESFENQKTSESKQFSRALNSMAEIAMLSSSMEQADRSREIFRLQRDPESYEIGVDSDITLDDYRRITPEKDWALLEDWAESMRGRTVTFINPTMEGGGVAMLRPPLVHMMRQFGIDAHWYVMAGRSNPDDANPFLFTKQMHNISQRQGARGERINEEGKAVHQAWNDENAEVLLRQKPLAQADVVMIDDPQPAPLLRRIKEVNPGVKIVWRNHIDTNHELMSDPTTPQGEVADYLLNECGVREADAVVAHPVEAFMHPGMEDKTYFAPATVEPFDDLNRELSREEIEEGINFINREIWLKNHELDSADRQELIDVDRRRIALVARFDESKGMDKAMALGVRSRQLMREAGVAEEDLPQVIIVGNGSVDDPSGIPMYEKMLKLRREKYADEKQDIILMRLRHNYMAMNALMYPAQGHNDMDLPALVGLQTSDAEGCETRISDWIRHGVPVVVANRGGMPLQVVEGESGQVINFDRADFDIDRGASFITKLMTDPASYANMRRNTLEMAKHFNNREFTTTANATRLLRVFRQVLDGRPADKVWKIDDMV